MVLSTNAMDARTKLRVLCWSERTEPASVYPNGINGALGEMFAKHHSVIAKYANIYDEEQGLTEVALRNTDVLIWFGHQKHDDPFQRILAAIAEERKEAGGKL